MNKLVYVFLLCLICLTRCLNSKDGNNLINGSMERLDNSHMPAGWDVISTNQKNENYVVALDSSAVKDGNYSLKITNKASKSGYGTAHFILPKIYSGKQLELKGFIKIKDVSGGFAGMWLRVDGKSGPLELNNMQDLNLKGTSDWKEYSIKVPYDEENAVNIVLGGLLVGTGTIWIDNLRLYLDGKSIDYVATKTSDLNQSTSFHPTLTTVNLTAQAIKNLALFSQVWGFLKYHHPAIAQGGYDMDMELFNVLPDIIVCKTGGDLSDRIETWIDGFGKPDVCVVCNQKNIADIVQKPDYGEIFNVKVFKPSLVKKLTNILRNRNHRDFFGQEHNYYVRTNPRIGNVQFLNEPEYANLTFPDVNYRLLCLFRYWNIIQYFYPNKQLTGEDWNRILYDFIPKFVNAKNQQQYVLTILGLISKIHDSHANIWSYNSELESYRGRWKLPFVAKFIEGKLVITDIIDGTLSARKILKLGDVIEKIDGFPIDQLIKKYLPITPASNYSTQLRDMPNAYLLRSNKKILSVLLKRNNIRKIAELHTINLQTQTDSTSLNPKQAFSILPGNIGYLFPAKYKNADLPKITKALKNTSGLIVDMRCYPADFMPFTFVPLIVSGNLPFAMFTSPDIYNPGQFKIGLPAKINGNNYYTKDVIVIVNEETQSQAEYTVMAFQSSKAVKVIGSTTAGADGDVENIMLPGGISTVISGLGVLYPDGTQTQRNGVKIDVKMRPTIKGIILRKDELLDRAKKMINSR